MKLHCLNSLVVEGIRQLLLSTCPAFHSFDTLITPTHHPVGRSWSIRYSTQQGVFRVDRSIPDVLEWTEYSYFSSPPLQPLLFSHSTMFHLTSTLRLTHSSSHFHSVTPSLPSILTTLHLCPILTHNRIPSLVLVQLTLTKHRSI